MAERVKDANIPDECVLFNAGRNISPVSATKVLLTEDRHMKKSLLQLAFGLVLAAGFAAATARADIAPPRDMTPYKMTPPSTNGASSGSTQFVIEQRSDIDVVRLQIPRTVLQNMQKYQGGASSGMTSEKLRTVFAGVFLSCAFAFGGVWVLRKRKNGPARAAAMLLIALAVAGTATTVTWANAGPPSRVIFPPGTLPKALKNDPRLNGTVVYEVVEDGDEIRLLVPSAEVVRIK